MERERIHDQWLVLRCRNGDVEAFEELVARFERRLFYYVMRMVRDEASAWDILQEVWVTVLRKLKRLRDPGAFHVWLYRIAHDRAASRVRGEVRREEVEGAI